MNDQEQFVLHALAYGLRISKTIDSICRTQQERTIIEMYVNGMPLDEISKTLKESEAKWTKERVRQVIARLMRMAAMQLIAPKASDATTERSKDGTD